MGNGFSANFFCCTRPPRAAATHHSIVEPWPPDDEALGHSFRYLRPSPPRHSPPASAPASSPPQRHHHRDDQLPPNPAFRAISGAAVSANSSSRPVFRPRLADQDSSPSAAPPAASNPAGFEGSSSFAAAPLQLSSSMAAGYCSGPLDRGSLFLSGPINRGALSGPLDGSGAFSGPLVDKNKRDQRRRMRRRTAFPGSDSAVLRTAPFFRRRGLLECRDRHPWVVPLRGRPVPRVQWAHGKAGEDRVHVVVSEEDRWLFVGIYDGFNGPDAPEFLAAHLYHAVFDQLQGLFWEEDQETKAEATGAIPLVGEDEEFGGNRGEPIVVQPRIRKPLWEFLADEEDSGPRAALCSLSDRFVFPLSKLRDGIGSWRKEAQKLHFSHWSYGEEGQDVTGEATRRGRRKRRKTGPVNHGQVLEALSRALESTELAYLEMTDREIGRNPELALMGSCLLVVVMREDDVYVMNVGDSRAIIAQRKSPVEAAELEEEDADKCDDDGLGLKEDIAEAHWRGAEEADEQEIGQAMDLVPLQLSTDHSTSIEEEVRRIKEEHPDDSKCIANNRVKGRLKVTRAFGAGFLKQPRWNNGLLEMFRNEYIGVAPYISCSPSLRHHKLGPDDQFLVISSDGLYQYLTNEEVVSHVQNFMEKFPNGDPAQSLIEELLCRAASKAGMDLFELLDIPQGDRRKYHDDVTAVVISLDGRARKS